MIEGDIVWVKDMVGLNEGLHDGVCVSVSVGVMVDVDEKVELGVHDIDWLGVNVPEQESVGETVFVCVDVTV